MTSRSRRIANCLLPSATMAALFAGACPASSFNCSHASTRVERIICSTPEVSEQDDKLATLYRKALQENAAPDVLVKEERQWVGLRNKCTDEACVALSYKSRIAELETLAAPPPSSAPAATAPVQLSEPHPSTTNAAPSTTPIPVSPQDASLPTSAATTSQPEQANPSKTSQTDTATAAKRAKDALDKAAFDGAKAATEYGIQWDPSSKKDEMTDGTLVTAESVQLSEDKAVVAHVKITCDGSTKAFAMQALMVDGDGKALDILNQTPNGATHIRARFNDLPLLQDFTVKTADFSNQLALTAKPDFLASLTSLDLLRSPDYFSYLKEVSNGSDISEANLLLFISKVRYQIKTSAGDINIKVTPYDPNVLAVIRACVK